MESQTVPLSVVMWGIGLICPGLVALGIWLGSLRSSTRSAHFRLDGINGAINGLRGDFKEHAAAVTTRLDAIVMSKGE